MSSVIGGSSNQVVSELAATLPFCETHRKRRQHRPVGCEGALWLKITLVQCALAASRKKASYLQAQFRCPPAPRIKEGYPRRCRLHPYRNLPQAQGWNALS